MPSIAQAYIGLKDIDDVEPLNASDAVCLSEVRDVLRKHGMLDRFGVTLLHSHFPIFEGETLVESSDHEGRTLIMELRLPEHGDAVVGAKCGSACVVRHATKQHERKHVQTAG